MNDTYKTIAKPSEEILFKEKNSKFFGYTFRVSSEEEIKNYLDLLRKQHYGAVQFCCAFQIGTDKTASIISAPNPTGYERTINFGLTGFTVNVGDVFEIRVT